MDIQSWSRFPRSYMTASSLKGGRKSVTLQELEDVIGTALEGRLNGLDSNSSTSQDTLQLLAIIVDRDMPARALDPQTDTGIYKIFESKTRLKYIMDAFREANESSTSQFETMLRRCEGV